MKDLPEKAQKVAVPPLWRMRLQIHRVGDGDDHRYIVQDPREGKTVEYEEWQFFVIEILPGCDSFTQVASIFEDRFGRPLAEQEFQSILDSFADHKLFGMAALSHPLLIAHKERRDQGVVSQKEAGNPSTRAESPVHKDEDSEEAVDSDFRAPGIENALGLDDRVKVPGFTVLKPMGFLKILYPLVLPLRSLVYVLPVILGAALIILVRYIEQIYADYSYLFNGASFVGHVILSMLTVNLSTVLLTALVAYSFHVTVNEFRVGFIFRVFPRFMVSLGDTEDLSRRNRMFLHLTPLLWRLAVFSLGIVLWFSARELSLVLTQFGLFIALIGAISFLLTANPLVNGNGYHFLSAFLDEPHLRGKSYKALMGRINGNVYEDADSKTLATYAFASMLFIGLVLIVFFGILAYYAKIQFGGLSLLFVLFLAGLVIRRIVRNFNQVEEAYERSKQFERWRKRALPELSKEKLKNKPASPVKRYLKIASAVLLAAILFAPYRYEPGGKFLILDAERQEIVSPVAGVVTDVYFEGGEYVKKGEVLARLSSSESQAQLNILNAQVMEQESIIKDLKSRPRPEEVELARQSVDVEKKRLVFSSNKLKRIQELQKTGAVSFEVLDEAKRNYEVDFRQVELQEANLDLVKLGTPIDKLMAADAKLISLKEEVLYYKERLESSVLHMPFDGILTGLHLRSLVGSYLDKGGSFAVAELSTEVLAEINIPESKIRHVGIGAIARMRLFSYYDLEIEGEVYAIDTVVTSERFGEYVKVVVKIENDDGRIKAGMGGYGKISSETLMVWQVFTESLSSFIEIEVWSWVP